VLSNCYHCSRQQLGWKSQPPIKSVSCTMTWPSMKNAMDASYALSRPLALLIWHVHSDLYSATSPLQSTLGNGQNFFTKLLSKSNNLCGSGSGRIFALPLPLLQKKDRFRFHIPRLNTNHLRNFRSDNLSQEKPCKEIIINEQDKENSNKIS